MTPPVDSPITDMAEIALLACLDPLPVSILSYLTLAPAGATELSELLEVPVEKIRYRLRRLSKAGLIAIHEERYRRGTIERIYATNCRETIYGDERSVATAARREKFDMQVISGLFREALEAIRAGSYMRDEGDLIARIPMALDDEGMADIRHILEAALERLLALREESRDRLESRGGKPIAATSGLLFFAIPEQTHGR